MECQEVWNYYNSTPSPLPSPQRTEQEVGRRGSKRVSNGDACEINKSSKIEYSKTVGGSTMLMEKLNTKFQVITKMNIKDVELINFKARTLSDSSITLADSLASPILLPGLTPCTPVFDFACTLIEDPQKRIILNGLPSDDA